MWAAAVPANYDRTLGTLIEDIYGDHQLMVSASDIYSQQAALHCLLRNAGISCSLPGSCDVLAVLLRSGK